MVGSTRLLEFLITDGSDADILSKAVDFFNSEFPTNSSKRMTIEFFTSKMCSQDGGSRGWLAVAMCGQKVVGTCSIIQKELLLGGETIPAVEIGDTFTSPDFRRDCHFRIRYPGTSSLDDYLNKSIFGRLATGCLDLARSKGIQFVYGVPNEQAKQSWLSKMGFRLVDGGATWRISSPAISHPKFQSSLIASGIYKIYFLMTLAVSWSATRAYALERVSILSDLDLGLVKTTNHSSAEFLQLANTEPWINSRFLQNPDKHYQVVKISNKKTSQTCGYVFFHEEIRSDGFRLLLYSKDLFFEPKLGKLKLPLARMSAVRFFHAQNLSMWIDQGTTSNFRRLIYGFISKPIRVDIVCKELGPEILVKGTGFRFHNFQYGDSDLG